MDNCDKTVYALIEQYINVGWMNLSTVFTQNITGKQKNIVNSGVDENLLHMLGSIRKYLVHRIFKCCAPTTVTFYAFGSENITSDYDLTIVGHEAPEVVWDMFLMFLKQYDNILPHAFDTNLYCSGMYSPINVRPVPQQTPLSDKLFVLSPVTKRDFSVQMEFAILKLIESGYSDVDSHPKLSGYHEDVKKLQQKLQHASSVAKLSQRRIHGEKYSESTLDMISRYYLTVSYAKKINAILYRSGKSDRLIEHACTSQYFAIESYYTPATVNVVVMSLQGGHTLPIYAEEYVISALENLADLRFHMQHERELTKAILLKYSKYVYRILYSLGKSKDSEKLLEQAAAINKDVIPHRKTGDTNNIDFELVFYTPGMTLTRYISDITMFVLSEVL